MIKSDAAAFKSALDGVKSVRIGTHQNPDGDALGSALALSHYLDQLGISNEVLCHNSAPRNLQFLPSVNRVRQTPIAAEVDLAIMIDLESIDRLGTVAPYFQTGAPLMVIDHHMPHEMPGQIRIIDTSAPAAALILARLLQQVDAHFTPEISTLLLAGIVTDTGSFRYRNTTPEALSMAAYLLEHGGNLNRISEEVFQRKPLSATRLLGFALNGMKMSMNGSLAWTLIPNSAFKEANATDEDTEGFVNEMLFTDCVRIAAIFREPNPGKVRCSIRSRSDLDVAQVARKFGGGGHKNAAGCTFEGTIESSEAQLVAELEKCLESS